MRQLVFIAIILAILVGGGLLTTQLTSSDESIIPVIQQTENPSGQVSTVLPWKAEQFFLLVGFVLVNVIGIGLTIALIMWFLDRGVRNARAGTPQANATATAVEET